MPLSSLRSSQGFVKTSIDGGDSVLAFLVFENSGLKAVTDFFDEKKSPIIKNGREEGWITGKWHANYYTPSLFRGKEVRFVWKNRAANSSLEVRLSLTRSSLLAGLVARRSAPLPPSRREMVSSTAAMVGAESSTSGPRPSALPSLTPSTTP